MFTNRKKIKLQGKTPAHRKSLIRSQVIELVRNEKIKTTPQKSRALKATFDKLVTKAKKGTEHSKRQVESFFAHNERAVTRFYFQVENKLQDRTSGYTHVIKTLNRAGDNAEQVYVMLVNAETKAKKSKISEALAKQEEKKDKKDKKKAKTKKEDTKKAGTKEAKTKE